MRAALKEKLKKIVFFQRLLQEKKVKFKADKKEKISTFEEYLSNLVKLYEEELKSIHQN